MGIDGGMMMAMVAEDDVTAAAKPRGYPLHVGHGGTGHLGKKHGGGNINHGQPAFDKAEQRRSKSDQPAGDPGGVHDGTGKNEQRDCQQGKLSGPIEHHEGHIGQNIDALGQEHGDNGHHSQGDCYGDVNEYQGEQTE
jgi:hypothetical protein